MTSINLGIQLNQLQLNKTLINIDFNNSPVDFWRFANFSRHNKIPSHIIFEQALEKGLRIEPNNHKAIFQLGNIFLMEKNYSEAIKLFDKYQIKRKNLTAIVGPCLSVKNYEVDKNFQKKFVKKDIKYSKFFKYKSKKKFY